jgi:hypothetical protein
MILAPKHIVQSVHLSFTNVNLRKAKLSGKYPPKNVWLFVYSVSIAGSPSFSKALLTRILLVI